MVKIKHAAIFQMLKQKIPQLATHFAEWFTMPSTDERTRKIFLQFLESTSMKGVPKVARAPSVCLRALWTIALLLGLSSATYFLSGLFEVYCKHSANLQLIEQSLTSEEFPDITLCNLNPFANTPYGTEHIDDLITTLTTSYNDQFQQYLDAPTYDVFHDMLFRAYLRPGKLFELLADELPRDGFVETRNLLVNCEWATDAKGYNCKDNAEIELYSTDYGYCFTFRQPKNTSLIAGFSAIIYLDRFSFMTLMPTFPKGLVKALTDGIRVILHPPDTPPIMNAGVDLESGHHSTLSVDLYRAQRLGPPHSVCTRDPPLDICWPAIDLGNNIRYGRDQCEDFCFQRAVKERCGCIAGGQMSLNSMRNNFTYCTDILKRDPKETYALIMDKVKCITDAKMSPTDCPSDCIEDRYGAVMLRNNWPHTAYQMAFYLEHIKGKPYEKHFEIYEDISLIKNQSERFKALESVNLIRKNFLQVNVVWKQDVYMLYREEAAMDDVALIGHLGGVLNLWAGITFFTVVEILELLIKYCTESTQPEIKTGN